MITVDSVSIDGMLKATFNQAMIHPSDISLFNYSKLFDFKLVSAKDGRIVKATAPKRRILKADDPCLGKLYAQMNDTEKM